MTHIVFQNSLSPHTPSEESTYLSITALLIASWLYGHFPTITADRYTGYCRKCIRRAPWHPNTFQRASLSLQDIEHVLSPRPGFTRNNPTEWYPSPGIRASPSSPGTHFAPVLWTSISFGLTKPVSLLAVCISAERSQLFWFVLPCRFTDSCWTARSSVIMEKQPPSSVFILLIIWLLAIFSDFLLSSGHKWLWLLLHSADCPAAWPPVTGLESWFSGSLIGKIEASPPRIKEIT